MCESGDRPGRWQGRTPIHRHFFSSGEHHHVRELSATRFRPLVLARPSRLAPRSASHDFVTRVEAGLIRGGSRGKQAIAAIGPKLINWISDARCSAKPGISWRRKGTPLQGRTGIATTTSTTAKSGSCCGPSARRSATTLTASATREVKIPKDRSDPSRGTRPISLIDIEDRVVQRAVVEVLQPLLDPLFGRNVLGFRPGHGRLHALALAEQWRSLRRPVRVCGGGHQGCVHQCAPSIGLLDVLAIYIPSEDVLRLIERLARHGREAWDSPGWAVVAPAPERLPAPCPRRALAEGMVYGTDDPRGRRPAPVCRDEKEAAEARSDLNRLLTPANMPLEGNCPRAHLRLEQGRGGELVGLRDPQGRRDLASKNRRQGVGTAGRVPRVLAHEKPDAAIRAVATINGWIDPIGSVLPVVNRSGVYDKLAAKARRQACVRRDPQPRCHDLALAAGLRAVVQDTR